MPKVARGSYYAVIPGCVRYDKTLRPNAKLLYGELTSLCGESGYCWAGNEYFAELYGLSRETVSRLISQLADRGYIRLEFVPCDTGLERRIYAGVFVASGEEEDGVGDDLDEAVRLEVAEVVQEVLEGKEESSRADGGAALAGNGGEDDSGVDDNGKDPVDDSDNGPIDENVKGTGEVDESVNGGLDENVKRIKENNYNNNPPLPPQGGGAGDSGKKRTKRRLKTEAEWKPERFNAFWEFYRTHCRGEERMKAVQEWDRLRPSDELIDEMGRALLWQIETDEWRRGIGIPYACRYLSHRRWEDTPPPVRQGDVSNPGGGYDSGEVERSGLPVWD